ncbi:MAG: CRISPR-associated protein Cas4 [Firmicutes bacterium]|nr:CRISPR-associated protein Cas4 [Bacillota bacterium]
MAAALPPVSGTLVWYYTICPRECWLMCHQLNPDEDDPNIEYGRFLQDQAYKREKKEVGLGANRIDFIDAVGGELVVVEVKKSSRALESARMQLAHYLLSLEENGVRATGELRFPDERRREAVILDDQLRKEVEQTRAAVRRLMVQPQPPPVKRIHWCRRCAYAQFCWA